MFNQIPEHVYREFVIICVQGRAKEMSPCLKIPAPVLPGNLASPCTANRPISESLSSILWTLRHFFAQLCSCPTSFIEAQQIVLWYFYLWEFGPNQHAFAVSHPFPSNIPPFVSSSSRIFSPARLLFRHKSLSTESFDPCNVFGQIKGDYCPIIHLILTWLYFQTGARCSWW